MRQPQTWLSLAEALDEDWDQLPDEREQARANISKRGDMDWHADAACASVGSEMFFGDEKPMSKTMVSQAGKICEECPVFSMCLRKALENEEQYGVWAGTSGRVRQRIQRMLVHNVVTIDEVVEDYEHGRRDRYEGRAAS